MEKNKLTRDDIIMLLKIVIGIALIVVAIKFFIKLLPLIIIVLIALLVYDYIKKNKGDLVLKKKKDDGIVDAEIIKEKKNR